jgi:hypothetical protein
MDLLDIARNPTKDVWGEGVQVLDHLGTTWNSVRGRFTVTVPEQEKIKHHAVRLLSKACWGRRRVGGTPCGHCGRNSVADAGDAAGWVLLPRDLRLASGFVGKYAASGGGDIRSGSPIAPSRTSGSGQTLGFRAELC